MPRRTTEWDKLTWKNLFPQPIADRFAITTGTEHVMEALKTMCDGGRAEIVYTIIEMLLSSKIPVLVTVPNWMPKQCWVIPDVNESDYIIAFEGINIDWNGIEEFVCLHIIEGGDVASIYARLCSLEEMLQLKASLSQKSSARIVLGGGGFFESEMNKNESYESEVEE